MNDEQPKPTGVFSVEELQDYFGDFDYSPDPQTHGAITIDPPWEEENLNKIKIPALVGVDCYGKPSSGNVRCHKKIAAAMQGAFAEIQRQGLADLIVSYGGCWMARHIGWNPAKPLSSHSWGVAIDLNENYNQRGDDPAPDGNEGSVIKLVPIFESFGFYWGGYFSTPDGMHFEYALVPPEV